MIRRIACLALALMLLLSGCAPARAPQKQYTATFLTLFDTVTTVVGRADSQEAFSETAQLVHDRLQEYHRLFDIYNEYPDMNNLKTVNDRAGIAPVEVDSRIIDLLKQCRHYHDLTGGTVNVALGSVLRLWHEARENALLPGETALAEASAHCSMDSLVIDEAAGTVFLSDPEARLDVGAVAKGWALEQVVKTLPEGLLISVGGNVCATGPKDEAGTPWVVGITNPDGGDYLHTLRITGGSVVTSGDYQRYVIIDGKRCHHIIDPETLFPGTLWRTVTVVCADSGLADALSTALFLMDLEQGMRLLEACGAEAMWMDAAGACFYSPGFSGLIRT